MHSFEVRRGRYGHPREGERGEDVVARALEARRRDQVAHRLFLSALEDEGQREIAGHPRGPLLVYREVRGDAEARRAGTGDSGGEGVEGGNLRLGEVGEAGRQMVGEAFVAGCRFLGPARASGGQGQGAVDARVHFRGGLPREGEHQDVARADSLSRSHRAGREQVHVACRQDGSLARAGAGRHDDVAAGGGGLELPALEVLDELVPAREAQAPSRRAPGEDPKRSA